MLCVRLLDHGGQVQLVVAHEAAVILAAARTTLELALDHLRVSSAVAARLREAPAAAVGRGVRGRLLHDLDHPGPMPLLRPSGSAPELLEGIAGTAVQAIPGTRDLPDAAQQRRTSS